MTQYKCTSCGAVETFTTVVPDGCSSCGSTFVNLTRTRAIAAKNDAFRRNLFFADQKAAPAGRMVLTEGIGNIDAAVMTQILKAVALQTTFESENDPYGEHDFGSVTIQDTKAFWKIDYYDEAFEDGSEDPLNDAITARVLTVMLAEEY